MPDQLLGEWALERVVVDRRAGVRGTVRGTTTLTLEHAGLVRWEESGTMELAGRTTPVSRALTVRRDDDGTWTVCFADGRTFHDWVWGASVVHACAPDEYTGVLAGDADRWTVRWDAVGPAKDYRLDSVLTPIDAPLV
ncbi:DUF6314 family protein [Curtobacterium sp. RRHDQ66]|uniref:DUF6314 family protein n=1 Tax=Curtobacterium guangdongense TaxID=3413380 RepID=UPI003BF4035B